MNGSSFKTIRPLTRGMIEFLMDCHERELMNLQPVDATATHVKGLIIRKLVSTKPFVNEKGKQIISICLTDNGRSYLNQFQ
jgi:hypothetical protein